MTTNPSHDPRRGGRQRKRGAGIGSWIWLFAWVLFTFWVEAALIRIDQAHIIGPSTICERVNLALQQGRCSFDAKLSWSLLDGQVRDEDDFIFDMNPRYKIYFDQIRNEKPVNKVRFVVIFQEPPQPDSLIRIEYLEMKAKDGLAKIGLGGSPTEIVFCYNEEAHDLRFIKDDVTGQPMFKEQRCKGGAS